MSGHGLERVAGQLAGLGAHLAALVQGRVDVAQVDEGHGIGVEVGVGDAGHLGVGDALASVLHAKFQHPFVTDDDDVRLLACGGGGQQLDDEFGADAGDVAQHEADEGFVCHGGCFVEESWGR
jgi:hypothetical protein